MASEVRTHVEVMVLKRSCPAVSQICSFTFSPFTSIVLILKSTPMVVMYVPEGRREERQERKSSKEERGRREEGGIRIGDKDNRSLEYRGSE